MSEIRLRDYQDACIDASLSAYERGVKRQLISSPVGSGKTVTMCFLYPRIASLVNKNDPKRKQVILAAHREELCDQLERTTKQINPNLSVSVEKSSQHADPESDVVVVSIPTIGRSGSQRIRKFNPDKLAVFVIDECHHAAGGTYINTLDYFGLKAPNPKAASLGFTATPSRHDKVGLKHAYDEIVYHKSMLALMEEGYLSALRCLKIQTSVDITDVKTNRGDFATGALASAVNIEERNSLIIKTWNKYALDRDSTLIFAVDVKHAISLRDAFVENGVDADVVIGATDSPVRKKTFEAFKNGKIPVLVNVGVYTEGADIPNIDCIMLARPTKSPLLLTQMCGRGLRLFPGKKDCLFLDIVDSLRKGSLMTVPSLLGLDPEFDFKGADAISSIKAVEKAIAQSPSAIKATSVESAEKIASQSFNPFEMKPDPEIAKFSSNKWSSLGEDHWAIDLKDLGYFEIVENALDLYEVFWHKKNGTLVNVCREWNAQKAFNAADDEISKLAPKNIRSIVDANASWRSLPATEKQLEKLKKWKVFVRPGLTRGDASDLMDQKLRSFAKKGNKRNTKKGKITSKHLDVKIGEIK